MITDEMVQRAYAFYQDDFKLVRADDWMRGCLEAGCGAEIKRLQQELLAMPAPASSSEQQLIRELAACCAEIERLQAALRAIIDRAEYRMSSKVSDDVVAIARAALTGGKE